MGHLVWNNKSPTYKSITAVYINTAPLRATLIANAQHANYWEATFDRVVPGCTASLNGESARRQRTTTTHDNSARALDDD